ncbi:CRTAC1 family protein [Shewanella sp. WXL01]|uniref:CRTAC1 family protein n=1 Tax=Shewanella sp. WXL01 TaxID=2709721 RepID=UPI00143826F2|nr:CRTAC1 family protein [Shewanella sp. WXL01]NKF50088.1 CRTAC1 family protein [Shewanella sp. WXL01]
MKNNNKALVLSIALALGTLPGVLNAKVELPPKPDPRLLVDIIGNLEAERDPKCHATATRLEGLIYGTPLSEQARYLKTEVQKQLVKSIWQAAATVAGQSVATLNKSHVDSAVSDLFSIERTVSVVGASWNVEVGDNIIVIDERDQQHYGSVAYTLRAMLAVQQDVLLDFDSELPQLDDEAANEINRLVDLLTLALLKKADALARDDNAHQVAKTHIAAVDKALFSSITQPRKVETRVASKGTSATGVLDSVIAQKIAAFNKYNEVSQPLFYRNLQVYFAKAAMPESKNAQAEFKQYFTEAMIAFSASLYLSAQANVDAGVTIKEQHVAQAISSILPHDVNEYEDVIFYPKYPNTKQVVIESYDMDAFRDSGLHWQYFQQALVDIRQQVQLEADPFAAELISEAIAHYGVLLLRGAGDSVKALGKEHLTAQSLVQSYESINASVAHHGTYKPEVIEGAAIISAQPTQSLEKIKYFNDITEVSQFKAEHRSSDWLSRQLRSYLEKDNSTGVITIPPAFGGSGIAAEDINGDGLIDILVLSGLGNKLFLNDGNKFIDVTAKSGLDVKSAKFGQTQNYGEPRQPLIADFDNDGDQDIIITYVDESHRIFSNNSDGTFTDISNQVNLGGEGLVAGPATTFDVNNDGLLDIYIQYFGNYLKGDLPTLKRRNDNGGENVLFINKGGFKFEQAAEALGANDTGWGQSVTHTDLNMDGWQDLIVGNDFGVNAYYINRKGKTFIDYAAKLGTDKPSYTMNISLTDLNRDGLADVYISNIVTMNKDQKYVLPTEDTQAEFNPDKLANMRVVEGNDLFISGKNKHGALAYQQSELVGRGYSTTGWAWDADFLDVDNDGDDDLYVLNGMNDYYVYSTKNPYYTDPVTGESVSNIHFPDASKASNVFFLNNNGKLNNVSRQSGIDIIANSRSATYLDFDNDGDLDVALNNYHDTAKLFENNAEKLSNNWLKIKLVGSPEDGINLDAIGAQVLVGTASGGYIWRQVSGSQGYMSVHPKLQHIGLGKADSARVTVIWPNGERTFFEKLAANNSYTISYKAQ